ncbi:unnamed protein product [Durusdinium trenchii]|uniref:J domain-containing protein n=1 Tax=Durusdinium trenchii TaxID=1381693 RepID=A0ABP0MAD6_9DINO
MLWQVVGGAATGGLRVRQGAPLCAPEAAERLPTGTLVRELQREGQRLHFACLGDGVPGPAEGWVSLSLRGRPLLQPVALPSRATLQAACEDNGIQALARATDIELFVLLREMGVEVSCLPLEDALDSTRTDSAPQETEERGAWLAEVQEFDAYVTDPYRLFGIPYDATDKTIKSTYRKLSLKLHPDRCPGDAAAAAKFRQLTAAKDFLLDPYQRRAFNEVHGFLTPTVNVAWWSDWDEVFAELEAEIGTRPPRALHAEKADVLLLGATGLTGTLACMVMSRQAAVGRRSWAIAGRDGRKLLLLQQKFANEAFRGAYRVETTEELEEAIASARVVLDFTGPSHDLGSKVAQACVAAKTHLIDNTGDIMFSKLVKETLDQEAKAEHVEAAGVALLLHAGYVSMPTDFGVWRLVQEFRGKGMATRKVDVYTYTQGFVMSGTSLLTGTKTTIKELNANGAPFVLGGVRPEGVRTEDRTDVPHKDENSTMIAYPGLNVERQVVRGTCGLMDEIEPYGPNFLFKDWFLVVDKRPEEMTKQESAQASRLSGIGMSLAGGGVHSMMVEQKKIPPPGWGPKERIRQETFVTKVFVGTADTDEQEKLHLVMNAGPGNVGDRYEGTATMMIEAAFCWLDQLDSGGDLRGGWGTPVYHLSHLDFWKRLEHLGFAYRLFPGAPSSDFMHRVFSATLPLADES